MAFEDFKTKYKDEKVFSELSPFLKNEGQYTEITNGSQMTRYLFDIKDYRIVLTICEERNIEYGTCNCTGFFYSQKCKHIHFAILKKDGFTTNPPLNNT